MREAHRLYLATVCLERTRWGRREPSFRVSEWLPRIAQDGFDGVELWEFHYLKADAAEQARLAAAEAVAVYNSYVGFGDDDADARLRSADAAVCLRAAAVKYNLGADAARLGEYRRNLLAWAERLPAACRLLCECHPGTVLEDAPRAAAFLAEFDPARFGAIVHISGDPAGVERWFGALEGRVQHLHVQLTGAKADPAVPADRDRLDACFGAVKRHRFEGSVTIEFTRGIGRDEDIEVLYANARTDLAFCREALTHGD